MYWKKCEVCGHEITDERRQAVSHSTFSETCSETCAEWLKSEVNKLSNEDLVQLAERGLASYGAETIANVHLELQARGMKSAPTGGQREVVKESKDVRTCYACGKQTDSLKCYNMINIFICLLIAFSAQRLTYTACPDCMRRKIIERALINIIPANVAFPIIFVMFFVQFCRSFVPGHTRG